MDRLLNDSKAMEQIENEWNRAMHPPGPGEIYDERIHGPIVD
jgi:hypothetical protein